MGNFFQGPTQQVFFGPPAGPRGGRGAPPPPQTTQSDDSFFDSIGENQDWQSFEPPAETRPKTSWRRSGPSSSRSGVDSSFRQRPPVGGPGRVPERDFSVARGVPELFVGPNQNFYTDIEVNNTINGGGQAAELMSATMTLMMLSMFARQFGLTLPNQGNYPPERPMRPGYNDDDRPVLPRPPRPKGESDPPVGPKPKDKEKEKTTSGSGGSKVTSGKPETKPSGKETSQTEEDNNAILFNLLLTLVSQ